MWIISSKTDIRTWVANTSPAGVASGETPDDDGIAYLVATISQSNHPPYGTDWAEWLDQQDWIAILQRGACMVADHVAAPTWTYEGYWNAVIGAERSAGDAIREYDLTPDGDVASFRRWLEEAEEEALSQGGLDGRPDEWSEFRGRAAREFAEYR
jgi:hypothetical protein